MDDNFDKEPGVPKVSVTRGFLRGASIGLLAFAVVVVLGLFIFVSRILKSLPDVATLKQFHHDVATEVFSDEGQKIGEFTNQRRYPVQFETIPRHVIQAFLAAEDSKFYEHHGIDMAGVFRAVFSNLAKARFAQGGSTITQQVARTILLEDKKKEITRKIREIILALRMEKQLQKNEILALYMSEIYLGHSSWGIGAAALNYFGKEVSDLSIAEGAMIAGLPQRPVEWDPFRNPYLAKKRQLYVLRRMAEEGFITEAQRSAAAAEPLRLFAKEDLNNNVAPYFTEYVRQYLMKRYGSENILNQGFKVYTTVRYNYQKRAEASVQKGLRAVDKRLGWRGVSRHLAEQKEIEAFRQDVHANTIEEITRARVLPADADTTNLRKLLYDLSFTQVKNSPYYGTTPVKEGGFYKAVVMAIDDAKGACDAYVGSTRVQLPIAKMDWIQIENKPIKSIKQILRPGDVVEVRIEKIDRPTTLITATLEQDPEIQGALLSYDIQTGFVRAMVGGKSFVESKFNRALHAKRQVGSTFKPLLYAAAIDKGFSPSSIVTDSPLVFKIEGGPDVDSTGEEWRPRNYTGRFEGDIPLRLALIRSMNIPTVKLLNEISVDYGIEYARRLGITANLPRDLSIGLGSWSSSLEEITRAYSIFPRWGRPLNLIYIKRVVDASGKVLEEVEVPRAPAAEKAPDGSELEEGQVISAQTAYVMIDMLRGVVREGTGRAALSVPAPLGGKTGTSNDHRDAWFVGFTPHVMTGVWIGFDKDKPLDPHETGGHAAAPVFADYMANVVGDYKREDFPIPDDIVFAYVDRDTGKLSSPGSTSRVRVAFKVGSVPNRRGDNLPRIGEPGTVRATTTTQNPTEAPVMPPSTKAGEDDTSDFLREGYQD